MCRKLLIIALAVLLFSGEVCGAEERPLVPKSPNTAVAWSLMGTMIPVGIGISAVASGSDGPMAFAGVLAFFGGSIVGPGLGHDYAGAKGRFWLGVGLRTAGWAGTLVTVALTWDNSDSEIGAIAGYSSLGLIGASALYDIATAGQSAEKYNQKHGLQSISLKPTFNPTDNTAGLQLALGF